MKKKPTMEEILKRQQELALNGTSKSTKETNQTATEGQPQKEETEPPNPKKVVNGNKKQKRSRGFANNLDEILGQSGFTENTNHTTGDRETVNEKRNSDATTNNTEIQKSRDQNRRDKIKLDENGNKVNRVDRVIDFIRNGNIIPIFGVCIAILLVAYVFGVFYSVLSPQKSATLNLFKALGIAFTTGSFFKFLVFVVVAVSIAMLAFTVFSHRRKKNGEVEFDESGILGTASEITEAEVEKLLELKSDIEDMSGFIFGKDKDTREYIGLPQDSPLNRNFAVCGSQGSMKSWGYVRNNIVQLVKLGESIVISDPKGEMYRDMSQFLIDNDYIVKQFNLKDMFASDSVDFLGDVNTNNIDSFCKTIILNTTSAEFDAFYDNLDLLLLKALCLYVKYEDKYLPVEERTLGKAYSMLMENSEAELDAKFAALPRSSVAKQTYMMWMKGDKAKKNSLVSLSGRLQIFQNPIVREITGHKDIDFKLPAKKKCAYFIIFNDQNGVYESLSSLFINQLIETSVELADATDEGKTKIPIHFLFDEFPSLGEIPYWKRKLATIRSRGLGVTMIFQNIPQMMNRYPDNVWVELLGGCDIQILLGSNDDVTNEFYSVKTGEATVYIEGERRQHNALKPIDMKALTEYSTSESYQRRRVKTPDEIARLRESNTAVLFISGSRPYFMDKVPFSENPNYPVKPHHARKNVPMWLLKRKNETNFKTEYGGIYNLGLIEDMPLYFLNTLDMWREEDLQGHGSSVNEDMLPVPYAVIYEAMDNIKRLNKRQGMKLNEILQQLINSKDNEFATFTLPDEEIITEEEENDIEKEHERLKHKLSPNLRNYGAGAGSQSPEKVINVEDKSGQMQVNTETGEITYAESQPKQQKTEKVANTNTILDANGVPKTISPTNPSQETAPPPKQAKTTALKFNVTERKDS